MRAKLIITAVLAMSMLVMGATGSVAAHDGGTDVGASGHCSDSSGGGGGSVGVSSDGSVDATDPGEVQSVAEGLALFAENRANGENSDSSDTCDGQPGEDGSDSYDYLEAHAGANGNSVQYCYSEENSDSGGSAGQGDQCHSSS